MNDTMSPRFAGAMSFLCVVGLSSAAIAQSASPVERARAEDPSNDRGLLTSHADTLKEGDFSLNAYELFFLGATYAFTDDFQFSFTTFLPIVEDTPFLGILNAKYVLLREENTVLSVQLESIVFVEGGDGLGTFGPALQFDHHLADGTLIFHGQLSAQAAFGSFSSGFDVAEGAFIRASLGLSVRLSDFVKILGEVFVPAAVAKGEFQFAEVALVNYGVRFHGKRIAADLAFLKPIGVDDPFVLGIPFLGFSARF